MHTAQTNGVVFACRVFVTILRPSSLKEAFFIKNVSLPVHKESVHAHTHTHTHMFVRWGIVVPMLIYSGVGSDFYFLIVVLGWIWLPGHASLGLTIQIA